MFTMLIHVFGISGVLYHGGGAMFHKIIPVLVDYIVQNGHIDPKISKIIQHFIIFLADTNDTNSFIKKTNNFCINQKGIFPI